MNGIDSDWCLLYLLPLLSISGNVFSEELFAVGDVYDISQEPLG